MFIRFRHQDFYKRRSPRARAAFWVGVTILGIALIFIPSFIFFSHISFRSIETRDARNKIQYGLDTIENEVDGISKIARDYAAWDVTYEYILNRDPVYFETNLNDSVFQNLEMNLAVIVNTRGEIIASKAVDLGENPPKPVEFNTQALLAQYPDLVIRQDGDVLIKGLARVDERILLLASLPVIKSDYTGPTRGALIFGRFLTDAENQKLSALTHLKVVTQRLNDPASAEDLRLAQYALTGTVGATPVGATHASPLQPVVPRDTRPAACALCHAIQPGAATFFITPYTDELLGGYTLLRDLNRQPVAMIGLYISREVEALERTNSLWFLSIMTGLIGLVGVLSVFMIEKNIKTEEARDRDYRLLRAVIDNIPDQIFAHDREGRFMLNNLKDAQVLGVSNPEALLGKSDQDFYQPGLAVEYQAAERKIVTTGQAIIDQEDLTTARDGSLYWKLVTKVPLRDSEGKIVGIVGVARDITERKQRERELEAVAAISQSLRIAKTRAEMLPIIHTQTITLLDANFGSLELIDPTTGNAVVEFVHNSAYPFTGMHIPPGKGLNRYILESGKPYLDNRLQSNPLALDVPIYGDSSAVAGAPMIAQGEIIGFLWIGRTSNISENDLRLLAAIANIAANAIQRASLHELTEKQLNQLVALRKIDAAINSNQDLAHTLGVFLDQTLTQIHADAANLLLLDPQTQTLSYTLGKGFRTALFRQTNLPLGESLAGKAAKQQRLIQVPNLAEAGVPPALSKAAAAEGFSFYAAIPLIAKTEVKGVLEVFFRTPYTPSGDWQNFLEMLAGQAAIAIEQVQLFDDLQRSNHELTLAYNETIEGWARALDLRDKETENHSQRVTQHTLMLATRLGCQEDELVHIRRGALLHDIGKLGVPDKILLKPGALDDEEWVLMRKHPQFALELLSPIKNLRLALDIPHYHHEKWDGSGYPHGLKGTEIPLAARAFAIIDVWDALSNDRPYRKAWPAAEVIAHLKSKSGSHFDPRVVEVFLEMLNDLAV